MKTSVIHLYLSACIQFIFLKKFLSNSTFIFKILLYKDFDWDVYEQFIKKHFQICS